MGFLSKLKDNFKHGGVKVTMQANQSVSGQDPNLPVTVTITNGPEIAQTINKITVEVQAKEWQNQNMAGNGGISIGYNNNSNTGTAPIIITLASVQNTDQFVLQPNESKTVNMNIVVGGGMQSTNGLFLNIGNLLTPNVNYTYELVATADVDGIALDPHAKQTLQILR